MRLEKTVASLKEKGYEVSCFDTAQDGASYLDGKVDGKTVGFGDSETLETMNLYDLLSKHNEVYDPAHPSKGLDFWSTAKLCLTTDIFFTSVNGLAETGEMVNIDGTGNRVAGSLFGHEKVYFVVGVNKVVPTLEEAIYRARNIAAPQNAARHRYRTPCAVKQDRCYDCHSEDRICCGQVIHYKKMNQMEMEVVLVKEALGL
ncbi:lactate utilization protein [Dethiosulfovibrio salsuginis]|uniref:Uncharacterized ACR, YkgG family COG1556 n=1 Tax=Dethiosulfovibrio salsuginis TaxID=561720 RepID=A0A1X7J6A9_9BACT|nr:lactate utilization protein [Dethiosulfovibrio salsuginis]SMG22470.1 Uncharacterised ACR, YkgG family COG1556 [Dethiosulfovibrio salsuginis]